jgi:hypothetical protein
MQKAQLRRRNTMLNDDLLLFFVGFMAIILVISIPILVLQIIAYWKIFTKAGEEGWKAIIPGYNLYIMYKIAWQTKFFWIFIGLMFLSGVVSGLTGSIILSYVLMIPGLVVAIIYSHKLSKSFGKEVGFTIGLIFLSTIFSLILAFGSARYIGPEGVAKDGPEVGRVGGI